MSSPNVGVPSRERFGEVAQRLFGLSNAAVDFALQEQLITRERLGTVLERHGLLTNTQVLEIVAEQLAMPWFDGAIEHVDPGLLGYFNATLCRRHAFFPIERVGRSVRVATAADDLDQVVDIVERHSGLTARLELARRHDVMSWVREHYLYAEISVEEQLRREISRVRNDAEAAMSLDGLLDALLARAVASRASDVHLRPTEHSINVAFRVDGVLYSITSLDPTFTRLISTVKLISGMDIADARRPQDGSFVRRIFDDHYDIRCSTILTPDGENVVLRILPRNAEVQHLAQIGFLEAHVERIREVFSQPNGVFLMTGPTGSGKTTTLHAGLRSLDLLHRNVVTIEEPVEYRLSLIRQTEVNDRAGYGFSNAVRHFLRHDPDIIVIGEIRDRDTADAAIVAAETGHLVLSTMHTNSALGVVGRFETLGIPRHLVAESLVGAMAQRLVRKLCEHCRTRVTLSGQSCAALALPSGTEAWEARGCQACAGTGYRGRVPIYEAIFIDTKLADAIHANAPLNSLRMLARDAGAISLQEVAAAKVSAGITSFEEVRFLVNR
jgi:type II secretory ATPase GspE/PulE/Tfp pilus assembly ATPase PilB-like protein